MGKRIRGTSPLNTILSAAGALAAIAIAVPVAIASVPVHAAQASSPFDSEIADFYRGRGGQPL